MYGTHSKISKQPGHACGTHYNSSILEAENLRPAWLCNDSLPQKTDKIKTKKITVRQR
jgi:hypothetical protein